MKKAWLKSWTTWVCRPEQRGSDGRIYAKQVVSGIPGGVQSSGLSKACSDLLGTATSIWQRERRLRGTLEPWKDRPLLQKEEEGTRQRGRVERVRTCAGVQGHRGGATKDTYPAPSHQRRRPASPSTRQLTLIRCHPYVYAGMCTQSVLHYIFVVLHMQHITCVMH